MDALSRRAIAEQLLVDHQLDPAAVGERARCCVLPGYWTSLCPGLSIGTAAPALAWDFDLLHWSGARPVAERLLRGPV